MVKQEFAGVGLKMAIIYEGKTESGSKTIKTMRTWPEDRIVDEIKKEMEIKHRKAAEDFQRVFNKVTKKFKEESIKI